MILNDFCDSLTKDISNIDFGDDIAISITDKKGIVTIFWSVTFDNQSNLEFYQTHMDEINSANEKISDIANKYKKFHVKTKLVNEDAVKHFDHYWKTEKQAPVKRNIQTNTMSFGSFVQFAVKY